MDYKRVEGEKKWTIKGNGQEKTLNCWARPMQLVKNNRKNINKKATMLGLVHEADEKFIGKNINGLN